MRASKSFKVILLISVLSLMIPGYAIPSAFASSCTAPPSNMISWWPGDGNALDIQDNNDGTLNGDATFAAGKVGQAFSLDGSGDFVEVANESNFDFADSKFAVDGWFKTFESGKRQMIVTKAGFTSGFSWQVEIATNNKLVTGLFQGTNGLNVIVKQSTNTLNDGAWHHFAVNFDNKDPESATLYIDGVLDDNLVSDVTRSRTVVISNEPVIIGARNIAAPQLFFNGLIDEVEIFDRFLTAQEIQDIFDADSAGKCKESIEIEKFYTFTNNNWDLVCTEFVDIIENDIIVGQECVAFREANINTEDVFAPQLPPADDVGPYVLLGDVKGQKTVVNPGQYIQATTITVPTEQTIWFEEDVSACSEIGTINPNKVPGGVQVVRIDTDGNVFDIDDDLALGIGGSLTLTGDIVEVHVDDVPAGETIRVMIKFKPSNELGIIDKSCSLTANLLDDQDQIIDSATVDLFIEQK